MDIVERLRRINAFLYVTEDEPEYDYKLSYEAADEIERMRNKVRWLEMCENTVVKQDNEIERLRKENQKLWERIMILNDMIQTEHEIIRVRKSAKRKGK